MEVRELPRNLIQVKVTKKHEDEWLAEVEVNSDEDPKVQVFIAVAKGVSGEGAFTELIRDLVVMVHDRNHKIVDLEDELNSFARHKKAISQVGPDGYVSPASQYRVVDPDGTEREPQKEQS